MTQTTSQSQKRKVILVGLLIVVGMVIAICLDRRIYHHFVDYHSKNKDWEKMLRVCGYLPVWLLVGIAMMLQQRARVTGKLLRHIGTNLPAGLLLIINIVACGIVGELLKLIVRRDRPNAHDGMYVFRSFSDRTFNSGGLGFPSSHAMVAFAATWILCRLYPKAWPVWLILGIGCGATRVISGAHFTSDVIGSMAISYLLTALFWHKFYRRPAMAS